MKNLRSLIHEKFPLELRVKIDLLSRRRDIINKEKQQELLQLLRDFNIEGVVQLGPGTNRYAIKLDGFVIKFATDHDGKIDNMKEFKMAKRLYPDVSKVYEVSKNGTIMVAEYIPPFESYTEMCKYADKIREKLSKIASVYLIGDVGITSKNYSNWGIRMGTDDPVCLDFAYVYEVSSELFICRHCKVNAMLVPNKDFTELYCSNKACGKRYNFEDIRARIGNDIHRHEIGDLSEEGYILSESNVPTELTESRSNYLARKKVAEEKKVKVEETIEEDNFVMPTPHMYYGRYENVYNKEDEEMGLLENAKALSSEFNGSQWSGITIRATATPVNPDDDNDDEVIQYVESTAIGESEEQEEDTNGEVAFSGEIIGDPDEGFAGIVVNAEEANPDAKDEEEDVIIVTSEPVHEEPEKKAEVEEKHTEPVEEKAKGPVKPIPKYQGDAGYQTKEGSRFTVRFIDNIERAISKVSNRIGNDLLNRTIFDSVKGHIKDKKMYPETFYKGAQNAVFRSLIQYCGFTEKDEKNPNGRGSRKIFIPPTQMDNQHYEPTLVFIERMWNIKDVSMVEDSSECIQKYHEIFHDYLGIQRDWLELLQKRIFSKLPIDKVGVDLLSKAIAEVWCTDEVFETEPEVPPATPYHMPMKMNSFGLNTDKPNAEELNALQQAIASTVIEEDAGGTLEGSHDVEDASVPEEENDNDTEDEGYEGDEDDEEYEAQPEYLSLEIFPEDDFDIIKLKTGDAFGPISIPFYADLKSINVNEGTVTSIVDDRNGIWDWLIHLVPDMLVRTRDPEWWLRINSVYNEESGEMMRFVIMDYDDELGYTIGIYYISGIFVVDEDWNYNFTMDENLIGKCNRVIREAIGYSTVSHLKRSLTMDELIYDEDEVKKMVMSSYKYLFNEEYHENDEEENDEEETVMIQQTEDQPVVQQQTEVEKESPQTNPNDGGPLSIDQQEAAAIAAMMMGANAQVSNRTTVTEAKEAVHVQEVPTAPVQQQPTKPASNDEDKIPVVRRRR